MLARTLANTTLSQSLSFSEASKETSRRTLNLLLLHTSKFHPSFLLHGTAMGLSPSAHAKPVQTVKNDQALVIADGSNTTINISDEHWTMVGVFVAGIVLAGLGIYLYRKYRAGRLRNKPFRQARRQLQELVKSQQLAQAGAIAQQQNIFRTVSPVPTVMPQVPTQAVPALSALALTQMSNPSEAPPAPSAPPARGHIYPSFKVEKEVPTLWTPATQKELAQ